MFGLDHALCPLLCKHFTQAQDIAERRRVNREVGIGAGLEVVAGRQRAVAVEQGVDQGAVVVARAGVHDQPRRLVDHHQVIVLEHDIDGDGLRRDGHGWGRRNPKLDLLADIREALAERAHTPPQTLSKDEALELLSRR